MLTVRLKFNSKEEALRYAEKRGYFFFFPFNRGPRSEASHPVTSGFEVAVTERDDTQRAYGTNYYAHNFLPPFLEHKLRVEGVHTKYFNNPNAGRSNYFRPLKCVVVVVVLNALTSRLPSTHLVPLLTVLHSPTQIPRRRPIAPAWAEWRRPNRRGRQGVSLAAALLQLGTAARELS
jgi:hypothetical protein